MFCVCVVLVAIHKTLSSILQLGNIQFIQDKTSDQAALPDNTGNERVALWSFLLCICSPC